MRYSKIFNASCNFLKLAEYGLQDDLMQEQSRFRPGAVRATFLPIKEKDLENLIPVARSYHNNIWSKDDPYIKISKELNIPVEKIKKDLQKEILNSINKIPILFANYDDNPEIFEKETVLGIAISPPQISSSDDKIYINTKPLYSSENLKGSHYLLQSYQSVMIHEMKHAINMCIHRKYPMYSKLRIEKISPDYKMSQSYGNSPDEQSARMDQIRFSLDLKPSQMVSEQMIAQSICQKLNFVYGKDFIVYNNYGYFLDNSKKTIATNNELTISFDGKNIKILNPMNGQSIDQINSKDFLNQILYLRRLPSMEEFEMVRFILPFKTEDGDHYILWKDPSGSFKVFIGAINLNKIARAFNEVALAKTKNPSSAVV